MSLYKAGGDQAIDGVTVANGLATTLTTGLAAGDYFVKIEANGDIDDQAPYTLTLTQGEATGHEIEPNDTLETANGLSPTASQQGRISSASDQDLYGFTLASQGMVKVNFAADSSTSADYTVEIVNANGSSITSKPVTDGVATTLTMNKAPGTYYLRVKSGGDVDQLATYTVSMTTTVDVTAMVKLSLLQLAATSQTMQAGGTLALAASAIYSDATSLAVTGQATYSSSDPSVLTVDSSGVMTGVKTGYAIVTASYQSKAAALAMTVGAPQTVAKQGHGNMIIVAGGTLSSSDTLKQATLYVSELAYQKFAARNFSDSDIYFMSQTAFHDLNGDGYDDQIVDDLTPTKDEVTQAITGWAKDQVSSGPLYLYLADH